MKIIIHWFLSGLAILVAAYVIPGISVSSFWVALVVAVVLGVLNVFLRPVLLILTLPINILTLGLFTLVINMFMIIIAAKLVAGFRVESYFSALIFSFALWIVNHIIHSVAKKEHVE